MGQCGSLNNRNEFPTIQIGINNMYSNFAYKVLPEIWVPGHLQSKQTQGILVKVNQQDLRQKSAFQSVRCMRCKFQDS